MSVRSVFDGRASQYAVAERFSLHEARGSAHSCFAGNAGKYVSGSHTLKKV